MNRDKRKPSRQWRRWSVLWRSQLQGDGGTLPIFRTRQDARDYISRRYGYIRERADLRREPHNWKMPVPVRITIGVDWGSE